MIVASDNCPISTCGSECAFNTKSLSLIHIFQFYDTPLRRNEYERRVREGTELIGTWWRGGEIAEIAAEAGFSCEIRQQNQLLYTAHYRFDALLELSP